MNRNSNSTPRSIAFILSETRSGSTWLSYVLGNHIGAAHLGEYYRPYSMQGHVACRLCQAKGLAECEILKGIESIDEAQAFSFAFSRLKANVLIDCSKQISWFERCIRHSENYDIKVVHLIRDPRAWYASERRRNPMSVEDGMNRWLKKNAEIDSSIQINNKPSITVFYDDLAGSPLINFPKLSNFLGLDFDEGVLQYWDKEHHGLGGNGAALNNLSSHSTENVITGDDKFYAKTMRQKFYDCRWLEQLSAVEIHLIESNLSVQLYLKKYGHTFQTLNQYLDSSTVQC